MALLVEYAPDSRRAFYAAFQQMAQGGALVLCGFLAVIVHFLFTNSQVNEWAWRIPFLFGIVIAPVGFYIRSQLADSQLFFAQSPKTVAPEPLLSIFTSYWKPLLVGIGVVITWTVSTYVTLYIPTFAFGVLKIPQSNAYIGLMLVGSVLMLCPLAGLLADRFSRKSVMSFAAICMVLYSYPSFRYLTRHPNGGTRIAVQIGMAVIMAFYTGPASALIAELFPTSVRSTGAALSYGLSVAIFGGFTPAIVSALVKYSGNKLAVAFWLMASGTIGLISLLAVQDRSRQELA